MIKEINIKCAFHQNHLITHFCKCQPCLLPLCEQCIKIHKKQHSKKDEPIDIIPLKTLTGRTQYEIRNQSERIQQFYKQTIKQFQKSQNQHKLVTQMILEQRTKMLENVNRVFQNIFEQLNENSKKRQQWLKEFHESIATLSSYINTDQYLRTVIMWNRLKPFDQLTIMLKKLQKQWPSPSFSYNSQKFMNFLFNQIQLKVLQIQGDSGVQKLNRMLKVLRFGGDLKKQKKKEKRSLGKKLSVISNTNPQKN